MMKKIAIFKTGTHTATNGQSLNATVDFIREVVQGYNPNNHEAPAVIGHPKDNHPAYGWVESLSFDEGEGVLYATFKQLESQFVNLLKDGRFKKRSASFYPPDHPANPTKGKPYLRHVGFLGAQAPAIKGLKDFSEDTSCPVYEFAELTDLTIHRPQETIMTQKRDDEVVQAMDFAEREARIQAREDAVAKREQALTQTKQQGFYDFTESLISAGKVTPAERESIVGVLMDADNGNRTFNFSEGGVISERSGVEALKAVLERLKPIVDFIERTASDPNEAKKPQYSEDMGNERLAKEIKDFAEKHNLDYAEAVQQFNGAY